MDALLLVKASVLLAVTLAAAYLMRRAPAVSRHRLWTLAFAAVLALPLLAVAMPVLHVPVPSCCNAAPRSPAMFTWRRRPVTIRSCRNERDRRSS
jgi:hypothetical protein